MKKLLLLSLAFMLSNAFYAQEPVTKKKATKSKTEKVDK